MIQRNKWTWSTRSGSGGRREERKVRQEIEADRSGASLRAEGLQASPRRRRRHLDRDQVLRESVDGHAENSKRTGPGGQGLGGD